MAELTLCGALRIGFGISEEYIHLGFSLGRHGQVRAGTATAHHSV